MTTHTLGSLAFISVVSMSFGVHAQEGPGPGISRMDAVQVTATRHAVPVQEVPTSISVITNEELRARGANDLRTALSLLGGVTVAPGGDDGPAGAAPGLLGQRELDDFLLVIDGVPAGGAFTPHFSTLNLNNVERIEVQRGAAPVFYGTTAFAGTINVIHYAAGAADRLASFAVGSFGSWNTAASAVLSDGPLKQSISADVTRDRYSDRRAGSDRGHLLYRAASPLAGGNARFDIDATAQHQKPTSPTPLVGGTLSTALPVDFNQNPADARIDTDRLSVTGGYDRNLADGSWSTTLAVTATRTKSVRGFLLEDPIDSNAAGFRQTRDLTDVFLDSHFTTDPGKPLTMTYGVNGLFGKARVSSQSFDYNLPLDGGTPPSSGSLALNKARFLKDSRSFLGLYSQARWSISSDLSLLAGARLNHTNEKRRTGNSDASSIETARTGRLSGSIGANWRLWRDHQGVLDNAVAYLSYGNTFQPPQIDFGPDAGKNPLLKPETLRSYEFGIKTDGLDGRLEADASAFFVDFNNRAIATQINGAPTLANGARSVSAALKSKLRTGQPTTW